MLLRWKMSLGRALWEFRPGFIRTNEDL